MKLRLPASSSSGRAVDVARVTAGHGGEGRRGVRTIGPEGLLLDRPRCCGIDVARTLDTEAILSREI
jgi:hypothetical protein